MSVISTTVSHASIYAIGNIVRYMTSFVMLPIYTRYLTPSDYGILELLTMTVDFAGIVFGMRIGEAIFRQYSERSERAEKHRVITTAMLMNAVTYGAGVIVLVLLAEPISRLVFGSMDFVRYVQLFAIILLLQSISEVPMVLLRAQQRPWVHFSFSVLKLLLQVSCNVYFIVLQGLHVEGVIYATLVSNVIFAVVLMAYASRVTGLVRPDPALGRHMIAFSVPLMLADLCAFYLIFGDRYFLRVFSDLSEVGIYSLGYKFGFMLGYLVWMPFSNIWDAQKYHVYKEPDGRRTFQKVFLLLSFVVILIGLGISLFVGDVLRIMSAPEFWPASQVVPVIIVAYVIQIWAFYSSLGVFLRGNTIQITYSNVAAAVVATVAFLLLIPQYGRMGAAFSVVLAFLVRLLWVDWQARKFYDMQLPWRSALSILLIAIGVYLAGTLWSPQHWLLSLAWNGALWVSFIVLFLILPVLTPDQKKGLFATIRNPRKARDILA